VHWAWKGWKPNTIYSLIKILYLHSKTGIKIEYLIIILWLVFVGYLYELSVCTEVNGGTWWAGLP
jgi:hypothetical protein